MSKKNKKQKKETTIEDFYDLKTDKVDELVAALKGEQTEDDEPISYKVEDCVGAQDVKYGEEREYKGKSAKEFNPYKIDRLSRIPTWIKALFIKYWFAGMVIYIVSFGLTSVLNYNGENIALLTGVILGAVVDFLVNPILRYFESSDKEYNPYIMFPFPLKKVWTLFTNIIYYIIVALCVTEIYYLLNLWFGFSGVEPLLGALFYVAVDMVFIGIKDLVVYLIKRARHKNKEDISDV